MWSSHSDGNWGKGLIGLAAVLVASSCALACSSGAASDSEKSTKDPLIWSDNSVDDGDRKNPSVANDQRREVFEEQDPTPHGDATLPNYAWLRSLAQESSVVLALGTDTVSREAFDPSLLRLDGETLGNSENLCQNQNYLNQPRLAVCSGTLIDDDLVLTAGHCLQTLRDPVAPAVQDYVALFGYYNLAEGVGPTIHCDTPAGQPCEGADAFRLKTIAIGDRSTLPGPSEDFAILQLVDAQGNPRKATPRYRPAPIRRSSSPVALGTPIAKVGAPKGIPLKISLSKSNANGGSPASGITGVDPTLYAAFVDTFEGDSGGGVYDATTFELIGSVRAGPKFIDSNGKTAEYVPDPSVTNPTCKVAASCQFDGNRMAALTAAGFTNICRDPVSNRFLPDTATRIDVALAHLCTAGTGTPLLEPPGADAVAFASDRLCNGGVFNDSCTTADAFELKLGHEVTLSGNTADPIFTHDFDPSCGNAGSSPDVFYKFEVTQDVMIHADTFGPGTNFDTVLFITDSCSASTDLCNDDTDFCTNEGLASQIVEFLTPGTYFLGVSGFNGDKGDFVVHLQALEASLVGPVLSQDELGSELVLDGNTSLPPADNGSEQRCSQPGANDFQVLYVTCPGYQGGPVFASTCDALTGFDTVVSFKQGSRPLISCNDDILDPAGCFRQSSLGFDSLLRANSGAGIRAVYVDGFSTPDQGSFRLHFTAPAE
jgi:hypothetical protein